MKVVGVSNFDNESVSHILVRENLTQEEAEKLADEKNAEEGELSTYFYVVKPDDYKLYRWEP